MKTPAEQCCSPVDWEETDDFLFIIRAVALFICNIENIPSISRRDLSHTRYVLEFLLVVACVNFRGPRVNFR